MRMIILVCLTAQGIAVAGGPSKNDIPFDCAGALFLHVKSHELAFSQRIAINEALSKSPVEISNFNFTNLWGWHQFRQYRVSAKHGAMLVSVNSDPSQITYLEPFGVSPFVKAEIIKTTLFASEAASGLPARFIYVSREVAEILEGDSDPGLEIVADSDAADYVYAVDDLAKKAGPKYQNYRTELNLCRRLYPTAKFVAFRDDPRLLRKAINFNRQWLEMHRFSNDPVLRAEVNAADRILVDYFHLNLFGGAIVIGEELVAYGVGESINPDTVVFHFLKGANNVRGINSALLEQMVANSPTGTVYLNLEEDLGYEGLRKHKQLLNPCRRVEKNIVRLARTTSGD